MKRILVLLLLCIFIFTSCGESPDVTSLTEEFVSSYGASGILYSTKFKEGQDGYIDSYLEERLFGSDANGLEYAVFLNTHLDYASECGAFLTPGGKKDAVIEICQRRMDLLDPSGECSFIRIYGDVVFYSTMRDKDRAERFADLIFKK